jgi:fumarate hydratase class I
LTRPGDVGTYPVAMPTFEFQPILDAHPHDTPYRLITADHVSTVEAAGRSFVTVEAAGLTRLAAEAMRDIAHLLRPGHLAQLRKILDDPESSDNDRFVALDLLKNANIAAGGILPMCQDTGTAIVVGKRGQDVLTAGPRARGVRHLRHHQPALLAARPIGYVQGGQHRQQPAGADRALRHQGR